MIARTAGRRVLLLERDSHPRFAIGESSTPLANLKLASLVDRYGLASIRPLCKYGPWKRTYPQVACGLKRGFSFFRHQRDRSFDPDPNHANELLVAANPDAERGDTHWYRADFDAFMVQQAQEAGVVYIDRCDTNEIRRGESWQLRATCPDDSLEVTASFLIDATGDSTRIAEVVKTSDVTDAFRTRTGCLYGHFRNVALWSDVLVERGASISDHPYPCDAAALHHVIDEGWMWVLRFDNGITSAGFSLNPAVYPLDDGLPAEVQWASLLAAYPSIARQFENATPVMPIVRVERLQRRLSPVAGADWAMLPHAAGFIDPWLSTGIAQTLYGLERLAWVVTDGWAAPDRSQHLLAYDRAVTHVFDLLDRLVAACLRSFDRFDVMVSLTMAYFAAAIYSEERIRAGHDAPTDEFLLANDRRFCEIAVDLCESAAGVTDADEFARRAARLLAPFNTAGLCDPERRNMYPFTGTI